jgi:hypothetical protein
MPCDGDTLLSLELINDYHDGEIACTCNAGITRNATAPVICLTGLQYCDGHDEVSPRACMSVGYARRSLLCRKYQRRKDLSVALCSTRSPCGRNHSYHLIAVQTFLLRGPPLRGVTMVVHARPSERHLLCSTSGARTEVGVEKI